MTTALLLLAAACGAEKNESADGSSGDSGTVAQTDPATDSVSSSPSEASDATTDAPTSDSTSTTGDTPTTTFASEPTSDATTFESATDTDAPTDPVSACTSLCGKLVECGLHRDAAACTEDCVGDLGDGNQECSGALTLEVDCLAGLDCPALSLAMQAPEMGACARFNAAVADACAASCGEGGGGSPDDCEWEVMCAGDPDKRMECDGQQCVCLLDGAAVAECAADDVCEDIELLAQKFVDCCGF